MKEFLITLINHRRIIRDQEKTINTLTTAELLETHITETAAEFSLSHPLFRLYTDGLVKIFKDNGGDNYLSILMTEKSIGEQFEMVIQRTKGKTPAQRVDELKAELEACRAALRMAEKLLEVSREP